MVDFAPSPLPPGYDLSYVSATNHFDTRLSL